MAQKKLIIGVTDCSKYANYSKWIASYNDSVEVVRLSYGENNVHDFERCHGIVLTGGEDVHPRFYGMPELYEYCYKEDVNEVRDEFEWRVLEYTKKQKLPVLGVCRGLQIANVFYGGTLIPDIPAWGKFNHSKCSDGNDRYHHIMVDPNSLLYDLTKDDKGFVNSNHHQSADKLGAGLVASAFSPDGVIEAIEWINPAANPFICLVQWHPERMTKQDSVFVKNIRKAFMEEAQKTANMVLS
ncbi:MAG: peptidase C26 [Bacteroidetes bacterium]|nr:MAG: peptidase C26 [Bacteroidota bacterium]